MILILTVWTIFQEHCYRLRFKNLLRNSSTTKMNVEMKDKSSIGIRHQLRVCGSPVYPWGSNPTTQGRNISSRSDSVCCKSISSVFMLKCHSRRGMRIWINGFIPSGGIYNAQSWVFQLNLWFQVVNSRQVAQGAMWGWVYGINWGKNRFSPLTFLMWNTTASPTYSLESFHILMFAWNHFFRGLEFDFSF